MDSLALIGSAQERHVVHNGPVDDVGVERVGRSIREVRAAARGALERTIQERHDLTACAGRIRRECRLGHTVRDAVFDGPSNSLGIVVVLFAFIPAAAAVNKKEEPLQ